MAGTATRRRWYGAVLAAVCAAGVVTAAPASAAAAAGTCSVNIASKLVVDSPFERFPATLAANCASSGTEYASWDIRHSYYGPTDMLIFDASSTDYWEFYDWEDLGTHYVEPSFSYDSNYDDVLQNTRTVSVRLGSRTSLTSSRSGSYVTLNTTLTRYRPNDAGFRAWGGRPVSLQFRTCSTCTWTTFKTGSTNSLGKASYRFSSSRAKYYRAITPDMSTTWGGASAATYR